MPDKIKLNGSDKVEITTLIDNYIDGVALDGTNIISRASSIKDGKICNSILAGAFFSNFAFRSSLSSKKWTVLHRELDKAPGSC